LLVASASIVLMVIASNAHVSAIVPPSVTATPSTFGSGAIITVSGTGFPSGSTVFVWLDFYSSGNYVFGEPSVTVKASGAGAFSTSFSVGDVPVGSYSIDAAKIPPPFPTSMASTPVNVVDTSTLGSISSAFSSLSTAISNLGSDVDTSFSNLQTHIDNSIATATSTITSQLGSIGSAISSLRSDFDNKLGTFSGGDTVASLLYKIESSSSNSKVLSGYGYSGWQSSTYSTQIFDNSGVDCAVTVSLTTVGFSVALAPAILSLQWYNGGGTFFGAVAVTGDTSPTPPSTGDTTSYSFTFSAASAYWELTVVGSESPQVVYWNWSWTAVCP
jgi:hypothetical protein